MTNKEAIKEIHRWLAGCPFEDTKEAFTLAIKALEEVQEWHKLKCICSNEGIYVYKEKNNDK